MDADLLGWMLDAAPWQRARASLKSVAYRSLELYDYWCYRFECSMDEASLMNPTVPVMARPANLMEVGPNGGNLAAAARGAHPVDAMQRRRAANVAAARHLEEVRHLYGSGLAMVLATEQAVARRQDLLAPQGLPQSRLYREIVSGTDVRLDFEDFLSLPEHQPDLPRENPHKLMERQLGMRF